MDAIQFSQIRTRFLYLILVVAVVACLDCSGAIAAPLQGPESSPSSQPLEVGQPMGTARSGGRRGPGMISPNGQNNRGPGSNLSNAIPETKPRVRNKPTTKIELPESTDRPVLMMDLSGGFRLANPDDFKPTPKLRIYADGRVVTGSKSPKVVSVEGNIDVRRVEDLIRFAVDECKFFDLDSDQISSAMEKTGKKNLIADAGTTEFKIRTINHGVNFVEVYALPFSARRFEEVGELSSLVALQARCKNLIAEINLGPFEEAQATLQLVNIALANESEIAPEFTMEHLQYAEEFVDGKKSAVFNQTFESREGPMVAVVNYTMSATGVPDAVARVDKK